MDTLFEQAKRKPVHFCTKFEAWVSDHVYKRTYITYYFFPLSPKFQNQLPKFSLLLYCEGTKDQFTFVFRSSVKKIGLDLESFE